MVDEERKQPRERLVDPETGVPGEYGGTSGGSITGRGAKTNTEEMQRGKVTRAVNRIDRQAQGNLAGNNPGTPQMTTGDQDSTQNRNDIELADPMTSRAPHKDEDPLNVGNAQTESDDRS